MASSAGSEREMTPLELMRHRNGLMHSAESIRNGREFETRPTDVFIVTYPKCGTTWMTQLCHQIRCLRAPDVDPSAFGEITEVVPWDILALDCDQNLNDDQVCSPRLFKSHESRQHIAPGARYVCVVRDPVDVFWSFYNFLPPYMGIPAGAVTPEEFAEAVFAGASHSGHCWHHFLGWYDAARDDPNVLLVCFEDMREDLASCARLVAKHAGVDDASDDEIAAVVERSGFEYMRARAGQFDDHFVRRKMWTRVGIDESEWGTGGVGKVREGGGKVGGGKEGMSAALRGKIDDKWREHMAPRGFATYDDFRAAVRSISAT